MLVKVLASSSIFLGVAPRVSGTCHGSSAGLPAAECAALQAFYDGTSGDGWVSPCQPTWRADPCSCNGGMVCKQLADGALHVTEMYLGTSNLTGSLSSAVSLKPLVHLKWLNLACNSLRGAVSPDFLDWGRFREGDDDRSDTCKLEDPDECAATGLPSNSFDCPIPPGAAADCFGQCIPGPVPVPPDCVRAAASGASTTSHWISFESSGLEHKMTIEQQLSHCNVTLSAVDCDFPPCAYWSPSSGAVYKNGTITMTLTKTQYPLVGHLATSAKGTRTIKWSNGVSWTDCQSPGAPDCSMST